MLKINGIALVGAIALSGCSGIAEVAKNGIWSVSVDGDADYVKIINIENAGQATPYAIRHCHGYGKQAILLEMKPLVAYFECKE